MSTAMTDTSVIPNTLHAMHAAGDSIQEQT